MAKNFISLLTQETQTNREKLQNNVRDEHSDCHIVRNNTSKKIPWNNISKLRKERGLLTMVVTAYAAAEGQV